MVYKVKEMVDNFGRGGEEEDGKTLFCITFEL